MLEGSSHDRELGPASHEGISLADVRGARDALRLEVKAEVDPLEERQRKTAEAFSAAQAAQVAGICSRQLRKLSSLQMRRVSETTGTDCNERTHWLPMSIR